MNSNIPCIVSGNGTYTMFVNGECLIFQKDHKHYDEMKKAYAKGECAKLVELYSPAKAIVRYTSPSGQTVIEHGQVVFGGKVVHSTLVERILQMMGEGQPFEPMVKFLENLNLNPSKRAVDELYRFLEEEGIPINANGCFVGYKRLKQNWTDCYTGTIKSEIGKVTSMPRNQVDDNWGVDCSQGYHVGSMRYVRGYCPDGRIVLVEVNPKDVVSVPSSECHKLRTCAYKVIGEYKGDLNKTVVDANNPYLCS